VGGGWTQGSFKRLGGLGYLPLKSDAWAGEGWVSSILGDRDVWWISSSRLGHDRKGAKLKRRRMGEPDPKKKGSPLRRRDATSTVKGTTKKFNGKPPLTP